MNYSVPEPLAYSVADACRVIGIKKTKLYACLKNGTLEARKCGGRTLIPAQSIRRMLQLDGEA